MDWFRIAWEEKTTVSAKAQTTNNIFVTLKWAPTLLKHCIYEIEISFNNATQRNSNMSIIYGGANDSHTVIVKPRARSVKNQYEKKQWRKSGLSYKQ